MNEEVQLKVVAASKSLHDAIHRAVSLQLVVTSYGVVMTQTNGNCHEDDA